MRHLPPIPWRDVQPGAVVLYGIPRTVHVNEPLGATHRGVMLEGFPAFWPLADAPAYPVELDAADAIGNLFAAGFTVTPITPEGSPS